MQNDEQLDQALLFDVIENQLTDSNPKEVTATLLRLRMTGKSREEALELIACALAPEMINVIDHKQPFNLTRYCQHLSLLPETPWLEEE